MDQEERGVMTKLEYGVLFSVLVSAASVVFSAGVVWTTVKEHDLRIAALEVQAKDNNDRLARIETKIDILIEDRKP